jgi:hypothetical protein
MAIVTKLNEQWDAWVKTRPKNIQTLCHKFPPNKLYLLKTSNHRVTIYSYSEDNTLTVDVTGEYNKVAFDRHVFDVKPEDLEECDLPCDNELLGTTLTADKDVEKFIDMIRPLVVKEKQA